MWLFGKKKETEHTPSPQELQIQAFAQQFLPDEFVLVAVTAPEGMSDHRENEDALWTLTVPLTAWMDEDDGIVSTEPALLQILADDRLRDYLRHRLPGNFIIKARVRPGKEGGLYQLIGMPEPGFDPELKALLTEQVKPVTLNTEDLGTFTLRRNMNWFETQLDWLEQSVQLTFNQAGEEEQTDSLLTARTLLANAADWDLRLRAMAADRLLEPVNEQLEGDPVTRAELLDSLTAEAILVAPGGSFTLWYGSDLLFGQAAKVIGTLTDGPTDAQLEE